MRNIGDLFAQCKETNKPMLVTGCGVQMLAYYCATGYKKVNVINGSASRKDLNTLRKITNLSKKASNVILDSSTGDFYSFVPVRISCTNRKATSGHLQGM